MPTPNPSPTVATASARHGMLLAAVLGGMFLAMLDQNIVGTALPRIVAELGGAPLYTWVVTAYLLTSTVTVPLYGRLSDVYGRRKFLLIGLGLFLAGSALCGAAQNMAQLIGFRALQGLGAGALLPISLSLIADMFRSGRAGRLSAMIGVVMATSYVAGPALGGLFTDHTTWRWVFLINVPLTASVIAVVFIALTRHQSATEPARPDYLGMLVFSVAVILVLVGLTESSLTDNRGEPHGWQSLPVAGLLAAGVAFLAVFVLIEVRTANPIVPFGFFRNPAYAVTNLVSFFTAFGLYTAVVFLPRYFQTVRGFSATASGLLIYPLLLGLVTSNVITGTIIGQTRRYKAVLSVALASLCTGCLLAVFLDTGTSDVVLSVWMLLIGVGVGPMLAGLTIVIQDVVPPEHTGAASATLTFFRQIGGTVALTIAGTLYAQTVHSLVPIVGPRVAAAAATATVLPVLGGIGAVVSLIAFIALPEWPLWKGAATNTTPL